MDGILHSARRRVADLCPAPTAAKGVGFVVLEDETGRLPLALPPALAVDLPHTLRDARYLVADERLERVRWYRSL